MSDVQIINKFNVSIEYKENNCTGWKKERCEMSNRKNKEITVNKLLFCWEVIF